jgi:hypothetical protein
MQGAVIGEGAVAATLQSSGAAAAEEKSATSGHTAAAASTADTLLSSRLLTLLMRWASLNLRSVGLIVSGLERVLAYSCSCYATCPWT